MARSAQIKLSDVATSRVNNLNFMRFIAALMVIVSHCYSVVLGGDAGSYLLKLTGDRLSPGGVSVGVFFLFGGFLIARSCEHYPEPKKFFSARVLRLFPELLFVVILTAFVLGPILSTLSPAEYFTNPQTYKYLLNGVLIMVHQLPGVFTNTLRATWLMLRCGRFLLSLSATFYVLSATNSPSLIKRSFCCSRCLFLYWQQCIT